MKTSHMKVIIAIVLTCTFSSAWCISKIDPINQKTIANFRQQHISNQKIEEKLVKKYINDKNKVRQELLKMAILDEKARIDVMDKIFEQCQNKNLECSDDYNEAGFLIMELDKINLKLLSIFMEEYPWFKISEFGEDGAEAAWLIVQHSNDAGLKAKVLFIMEHLLKTKEAKPENYALLYDRLTLEFKDLGIKQRYGSQFSLSEDHKKLIFEPCEGTIKQIDKKRKQIGLMSLKNNTKRLMKENHIKEVVGLDF